MSREYSSHLRLLKESQVFKKQTEKSIQQKVGIYLLFSGLKHKGRKPYVLTTEEWNTTSAHLKILFMKEVDSLVHIIMWPKWTCDMREFLKHCDKGDHFVSHSSQHWYYVTQYVTCKEEEHHQVIPISLRDAMKKKISLASQWTYRLQENVIKIV